MNIERTFEKHWMIYNALSEKEKRKLSVSWFFLGCFAVFFWIRPEEYSIGEVFVLSVGPEHSHWTRRLGSSSLVMMVLLPQSRNRFLLIHNHYIRNKKDLLTITHIQKFYIWVLVKKQYNTEIRWVGGTSEGAFFLLYAELCTVSPRFHTLC